MVSSWECGVPLAFVNCSMALGTINQQRRGITRFGSSLFASKKWGDLFYFLWEAGVTSALGIVMGFKPKYLGMLLEEEVKRPLTSCRGFISSLHTSPTPAMWTGTSVAGGVVCLLHVLTLAVRLFPVVKSKGEV